MTCPQDTSPPPSGHGFDAKGFFASFLYGMGAFMGVAALFGLALYAYLILIFDILAGR